MKNRDYPLYDKAPQLTSLREMLEIKAAECPGDVAIRYPQGRKAVIDVTYGAFYDDVRNMSTYLLKHHVRNSKVALLGENSYQWLVAYFAIVTTGNVAVLIAKDSTDAEVATMLFQTKSDILLYSKSCTKTAEAVKKAYGRFKPFHCMTSMDKWIEKGRRAVEKGKDYYDRCTTDPDKLCTIFFTSGSTGFSKGVMLSQTNICSDINSALQFVYPDGPTLSVLPYNHAFGLVIAVMVPLHSHMEIFICSKLANFMREIPMCKPKTLALVPLFVETFDKTIWRTAAKEGQEKTLKRGIAASDAMLRLGIDRRRQLFKSVLSKFGGELDCIICGGAPLDPKLVKEFRSFGIEVLNGYGITECSPVLAVNRMGYHRDGSVGQVLPGIELRIDNPDKEGNGEIVVRGRNVMMGYYNDPQSTAQVLDEDGWFHTGDLGHLDKDGFLYITGRKKSLIILANGENVSPEELEQYVSRIDQVSEVVVYEADNAITAEVYPEESDLPRDELFKVIQDQIDKMNKGLPSHKHIQKLVLRATEFEKTATRKIKRYKTGTKDEGKETAEAPEAPESAESAPEASEE